MKFISIVFAALLGIVGLPAKAQTYTLVLAGASPGGLWSLLGTGVDRAVKASYPGSVVTYQTSGGGFANIGLLDTGKASLGLAHDAELKIGLAGEKPFNHPIKSIRAIAYLYDWGPMQLIMAKSFADQHGIKTFEDIAKKKAPVRVALNRRGNISEGVSIKMFAAIGVTPEDIERWGGKVVFAASREQGDLYKDGRVDLIFNSLFVRHGSLLQATQSVDSVMLPVSDAVIEKVGEEMGIKKFVIPAKSYDFQPDPMPTATLGAILVTTESLDEKTAYDLTKALLKNIDKVQGVHKSMQALTPELMASVKVVPYHPGAARAYKEAGLLK